MTPDTDTHSDLFYLSDDEYFANPRMSKHKLDEFLASPWKFFEPKTEPPKESPALLCGTAAHAALLTPDKFKNDFVSMPPSIKVRRGKAWDDFLNANKDKTIIPADVMDYCLHLQTIVPTTMAGAFLESCSRRETVAFWNDEPSAVDMKARLDAVSDDCSLILDLKTCQDCSIDAFLRDADNFGYDVQAAIYIDALKALGKNVKQFAFICIEKNYPVDVACHFFEPNCDFVNAGRYHYQNALAFFAECSRGDKPLARGTTCTSNAKPVPWSRRYKAWLASQQENQASK